MSLTQHRDLRDGEPVWRAYRSPTVKVSALRRSVRCDVAVVGAGISGALVAHALTEMGYKPLIVDRRRSALLGSTAASTALLQFELDTPLSHLARSIGRRAAEQVWLASRNAVNELRTRTHRVKVAADMITRPSLYVAGNVLDARGLRAEVRQRQRIGLASEYLDRAALRHHFDIDREAAVLNHGNAEANPVKLAAGYLQLAIAGGARVHAPCDVVDLQATRRGTTLSTADGMEILASRVVLCTGYELAKIVPPTGSRILSTWAIATRRQPGNLWPQRALLWEASEPYLYARTTLDGRVICGGEDAEMADPKKRDALVAVKSARIAAKLRRLLPNIDARAEYAWSGSFGGSANGMPTIGEIPGYPRCYAVMGYGGNGITFSMLAAQLLTAAIAGKKVPEAKLFAFKG